MKTHTFSKRPPSLLFVPFGVLLHLRTHIFKVLIIVSLFLISAWDVSGQTITYTLDKPRFYYFLDNVNVTPTVDTSVIDSIEIDHEIASGVWFDPWSVSLYGSSGILGQAYDYSSNKWQDFAVEVYKYGTIVDDPNVGFNMGDTMNVKMWGYKNNALVDSVEFVLPVGFPTSITLKNIAGMSIYPNPTNGIMIIEGLPNDVLVQILDVVGKVLHTQASTQNTKIDFSSYPSGLYFIKTPLGIQKVQKQ